MNPIKLIVIEDHELMRFGIGETIKTQRNINLIGESDTALAGLKLVKTLKPDVAIVDLILPDLNGLELIQKLRREHPPIKIVILSAQSHEESVINAFKFGADAYCVKSCKKEKLVEAIYSTIQGEVWIDPGIGKTVISLLKTNGKLPQKTKIEKSTDGQTHPISLTDREIQILELIAQGEQNIIIAERLHIAVGTVRTHVHRIIEKLEVSNRYQAAVKATKAGWLKPFTDLSDPHISDVGYKEQSKWRNAL